MTMGEKTQKLRKQKNWSQETLAEKVYDDYRSCTWFQKLWSRVTGK